MYSVQAWACVWPPLWSLAVGHPGVQRYTIAKFLDMFFRRPVNGIAERDNILSCNLVNEAEFWVLLTLFWMFRFFQVCISLDSVQSFFGRCNCSIPLLPSLLFSSPIDDDGGGEDC